MKEKEERSGERTNQFDGSENMSSKEVEGLEGWPNTRVGESRVKETGVSERCVQEMEARDERLKTHERPLTRRRVRNSVQLVVEQREVHRCQRSLLLRRGSRGRWRCDGGTSRAGGEGGRREKWVGVLGHSLEEREEEPGLVGGGVDGLFSLREERGELGRRKKGRMAGERRTAERQT